MFINYVLDGYVGYELDACIVSVVSYGLGIV